MGDLTDCITRAALSKITEVNLFELPINPPLIACLDTAAPYLISGHLRAIIVHIRILQNSFGLL